MANCTTGLGAAYISTGRYEEAESCYKEALTVYRRIPGKEAEVANCTTGLGAAYISTGRYREAESCYKEALTVYRRIPGKEAEVAGPTNVLGFVYDSTSRYGEAKRCYQDALLIFQGIPGTEMLQANCSAVLAGLFLEEFYDFPESLRYAEEALKLCETLHPEAAMEIRATCEKILQEIKEKDTDLSLRDCSQRILPEH